MAGRPREILAHVTLTAPPGHDLLAGKVVVITAAAGTGIGSATARRCLDEGASVAVSDRHQPRLAEIHDELAEADGGRVWSAPCDVTEEREVEALVAGAVRRFGRIDVLINNAGLGGTSSVLEMTDEQWLRVLDVTLNGTFRCTRAALRQMVAQGHGGAVVNNASVLGWRAQPGQAHCGAAVGGGQRHRVPGQRLRLLPDRRGGLGQQPASLTSLTRTAPVFALGGTTPLQPPAAEQAPRVVCCDPRR